MLFDVILTDWNLYHFFIMWFSQYDIILIFLFSLETNEAILKSAYDCRWDWHRNDSRFFGPYKPLKGHRSQFAIRRKRRAGEKVAQIRVTSRSELTETDSLGTSIHRAPIFSGPFIDFFSLLPLNRGSFTAEWTKRSRAKQEWPRPRRRARWLRLSPSLPSSF